MVVRRGPLPLFVIVASLSLSLAGSACDSPTPPTASLNLTGAWSGSASDSSGPGQMTWRIDQAAGSFSGTFTMTDTTTNLGGRGSISGTVSASTISFSMSVPAGGFDDPYAPCSARVTGDGQASAATITGTYSGSNSCSGEIVDGRFTLSRP